MPTPGTVHRPTWITHRDTILTARISYHPPLFLAREVLMMRDRGLRNCRVIHLPRLPFLWQATPQLVMVIATILPMLIKTCTLQSCKYFFIVPVSMILTFRFSRMRNPKFPGGYSNNQNHYGRGNPDEWYDDGPSGVGEWLWLVYINYSILSHL